MKTYLYLLRFPNGQGYVGVTSNLTARMRAHKTRAKCGSKAAVHVAIRAFGIPEPLVLAAGKASRLQQMERATIKRLGTAYPAGLNMTGGGLGTNDPVPALRARISEGCKLSYKRNPKRLRQISARSRQLHKDDPDLVRRMIAGRGPQSAERRAAQRARMRGNKHLLGHKLRRSRVN